MAREGVVITAMVAGTRIMTTTTTMTMTTIMTTIIIMTTTTIMTTTMIMIIMMTTTIIMTTIMTTITTRGRSLAPLTCQATSALVSRCHSRQGPKRFVELVLHREMRYWLFLLTRFNVMLSPAHAYRPR